MVWRMAQSLEVLRGEINRAAPRRSTLSDGGIGDAAHASRSSDHNPWVTKGGQGIVRARDFTHDPADGCDAGQIANAVVELMKRGTHPALRSGAYVIYNRRIFSYSRRGEGWRPYTGSNAHTKHVHVSVTTDLNGFDSTIPWGIMGASAAPAPAPVKERRWVDYSYSHPAPAAIKRGGYLGVVRYIASGKAGKQFTDPERKALHAQGLNVNVVFEADDQPARAKAGKAAGIADTKRAEDAADALGLPLDCPIFYAVDYDATVEEVRPYFTGVCETARRPVGIYGSWKIIEAKLAPWRWQTAAWSAGKLSQHAHLYQRAYGAHQGSIPGHPTGWDENVIIAEFPSWGPNDPKVDMPLTDADVTKILTTKAIRNRTPDGKEVLTSLADMVTNIEVSTERDTVALRRDLAEIKALLKGTALPEVPGKA